ncbi:MAG TPA: dihydrolipoamide acetyltransferase family protein [Sedimentisphaerales bacterium]|nr:dihydrolipoamide acetyltransferase family protein [Sedimentisphaerales bacterium]
MATEVKLPQLGQTMEEGTIVNYLVSVGDEVKKGDVIFEVETDKATLEVESPADGFVKQLIAEVGQTLLVGEPVLILGARDEQAPKTPVDSLKGATAAAALKASADRAAPATTPSAAKTAAPAAASSEIKLGQTIPLNRLQKITAQKMLQSKRDIPCFYLNVKADVTDLVELRTKLNKTGDVKISYNDFLMRSVAIGLEKFPIMTGQLDGDTIKLAESIDVGLAIAVPDGLVAPIIRNVSSKDIRQIARESAALIEKARNAKLTPDDLDGGCITVSNLGAFGIDSFIPIVVPGQCSILGVGKITDTCVPDDSGSFGSVTPGIAVRKLMSLTLSVDHRITNGTYAAQFLDFVRKLLEDTSNFV